jgi:hypothetical protein
LLAEFHAALTSLVHERGHIAPDDVDVSFEAPVKPWIGARLRQTAPETFRANGRGIQRVPPRRFDLRYLISALTTVVADEHLLIWRTLATLMKHPTIPIELLPESVRSLGIPVTGKMAAPDDAPRPIDVWSALEGPPRPSLIYVVTLPLDLELTVDAPLVLTRTERFAPLGSSRKAPDVRAQIGGRVRDRSGAPVAGARVSVEGHVGPETLTDATGQFKLAGLAHGSLTLAVQGATGPPTLVPIEIPSDSYDIVTD